LLIIGPIISFGDKGPVFYNALRLGKNGKTFKMYKFRSMRMNAPDIRNKDGSTFISEDDLRLTKIGKFIRKTSIDELPQIFNVFKGDMSIIGPRPDLPEQRMLYDSNEERKLEVKPGITGYNQAYFRNAIPWKERIQNDIYYIDHLSLGFDVRILLKTFTSVIKGKNIFAKQSNENRAVL
jgi:lipopolysaccharide/colanic/teichoic acid biosynthesis glycosyltransferase